MLLCNDTMKNAVEVFLREAHIPCPHGWTREMDVLFINNAIVPAFYKALQEIEEVQPCYGFDLKKVRPNQGGL